MANGAAPMAVKVFVPETRVFSFSGGFTTAGFPSVSPLLIEAECTVARDATVRGWVRSAELGLRDSRDSPRVACEHSVRGAALEI